MCVFRFKNIFVFIVSLFSVALMANHHSIQQKAVRYLGTDRLGGQCNLFVSLLDDHHHNSEEHSGALKVLIKADYATSDGHRPSASFATFYNFNSRTGVFSSVNSIREDSEFPTLMAIDLTDKSIQPDPNRLSEYRQSQELEQFLKFDFAADLNVDAYVEAIESLIEGDATIEDEKELLSSFLRLSMGLKHGDHYHFPRCQVVKAVSVEETSFSLNDGHDHGHDH